MWTEEHICDRVGMYTYMNRRVSPRGGIISRKSLDAQSHEATLPGERLHSSWLDLLPFCVETSDTASCIYQHYLHSVNGQVVISIVTSAS